MEIQNNDDFKYVIQDTNCIYFGKELSYVEMMDKEDIPFKFKAIISSYITKDCDINSKMTEHILKMTKDEFSYRIFEQLKMAVRICYNTQKKGFGGKIREKWVHKKVSINQFCSEYQDDVLSGKMIIEDISISKLSLLAISI